jgi:hypothetical protein
VLELRAGLPARLGQKGKAAAYSLKEVRRRERALPEQAEVVTVNSWPAGSRAANQAATEEGRGRRHCGATLRPSRAKLRARASSPTTLLFAPGSTTPNAEPNDAKTGGQRHTSFETFIRAAQLGVVGGREGVEGQQIRLGLQQQPGHLGHPVLQMRHGLTQQPPGLLERVGPEDRADRRAD